MEYTFNQTYFYGFASFSVEYYLIGRNAIFQSFTASASVSILHRAVEMVLKAGLIKKRTLHVEDTAFINKLGKGNFSHNLDLVWREFKIDFPDDSLKRFDGFVTELNKWNEMKYPDSDPKGMQINFTDTPPVASNHITHHLDMIVLDEFIHVLWKTTEFDPLMVIGRIVHFTPGVKDLYQRQNKSALKF